ncbi:MAG: hypothetical protein ACLR8P_15475 [Clostridium fessum]
MKETGWKKTAGNGSDGKRTEGKKSFGRGRKQMDFPRIVQKWESMGKNRENLLVKCLELRINGAHMGTGNEM